MVGSGVFTMQVKITREAQVVPRPEFTKLWIGPSVVR